MNVLPPLRSLISVTRVVLDKVGNVLERYNYYPYGEIVPVASSGNTDNLYTGKESQNASRPPTASLPALTRWRRNTTTSARMHTAPGIPLIQRES